MPSAMVSTSSETLTSARRNELNNDPFEDTLGPVKQVMKESGPKKNQIDVIALVFTRCSRVCEGGAQGRARPPFLCPR